MSNLFLDQRYADLLAPDLPGFVLKSSTPYKANCRCVLCGDSAKNKTKRRGWILQSPDKEGLLYYCHNCNASMPFWSFLSQVNSSLFTNYDDERRRDYIETLGKTRVVKEPERTSQTTPVFKVGNTARHMTKISSLPIDHPARKYIADERKIPSKHHYRIFYCPDFPKWINSIIPDKLPAYVDPRIVIPIYDRADRIIGVVARTMKKALRDGELRYINIMFDESYPKTYGLDKVDYNKAYFVTEGIFDSFFLPNCIAINGSAIDFGILHNRRNAIFVLDNQPRDYGVVKTMKRVIEAGMRVVVWPNTPVEKEDINQMVLEGKSPTTIIKDRVFSGLAAVNALNEWKRI